jgi:hypothetical protein
MPRPWKMHRSALRSALLGDGPSRWLIVIPYLTPVLCNNWVACILLCVCDLCITCVPRLCSFPHPAKAEVSSILIPDGRASFVALILQWTHHPAVSTPPLHIHKQEFSVFPTAPLLPFIAFRFPIIHFFYLTEQTLIVTGVCQEI